MLQETYKTIAKVIEEKSGVPDAQLIDGGEHADLATTIAFTLAKQKKQSPVLIAKDLAAELAKDPALQGITIEAKGPYINFIFGAGYVSEALREAVKPG